MRSLVTRWQGLSIATLPHIGEWEAKGTKRPVWAARLGPLKGRTWAPIRNSPTCGRSPYVRIVSKLSHTPPTHQR